MSDFPNSVKYLKLNFSKNEEYLYCYCKYEKDLYLQVFSLFDGKLKLNHELKEEIILMDKSTEEKKGLLII